MNITKTVVSTGVAVWSTVHETAIGGFTLDKTGLVDGQIIPAGTPMGYDEATRLAKPVNMAVLNANATNVATTYQVKKGHNLAVGMHVGYTAGGTAYTITAIDTTDPNYDVITLGTTLGVALTTGQALFQSSATGASSGAFSAKGLLYEETTVGTNVGVSVVLRGTLYARRAPVNNASIQEALPLIIFSQSY